MKLTKARFEYTYPDGSIGGHASFRTVAERTATPGLIVTPYNPVYAPPRGHRYVITHEATGLAIVPPHVTFSRKLARLVAGALGGIADWSSTSDSNTLRDKLKEAGMYDWLRYEVGQ